MKKIFFIIFIISFLIILPKASGEYVWKRIDLGGGYHFRSFCEDSLGNIYLSHSWRIFKSNDDGYNWSEIYTLPSNAGYIVLNNITSTKESILFVGGDSLLISHDQGASFINISHDIDTIKVSYSNLCIYDSTLFLFKNKYFYKSDEYISYLMYSSDLGKNWNLIDSFPGLDKNYIKGRTPVDLKVDYDGSLFFIVDTNYYYKKDILTEPKIIKHEKFLKHNDYFFIPEGKDIFLINNYQLFKLDKKTLDLIEYSLPNIGFTDLNYHLGTFFCLRGTELYQSKDTMKTWEFIIEMKSGLGLLPRLFVTRKGTILIGDSYTGLHIGRKASNIIERNNEYIAIFPNPVGEYIEISGLDVNPRFKSWVDGGVGEIRIYNVLGECVKEIPPTPLLQRGIIRVDVSVLPAGVYFVRYGEWTGKFVKLKL